MRNFISKRFVVIAAAGVAFGLSACSSHYHGTRYGGGPCQIDCMPMPAPQPVYYMPPRPTPLPPPTTTVLTPAPEPLPTPEPVTCPSGWMMGPKGVCLEIVTPTYVPPSTGYPDPPKRPRTYKPKRK